ncbi:E3 ubiquitin-protein ligase TRIM34-like [Symsagittifera roscoffensis]|uniref:E3 ubiquitin-protein ligase TRIM34-like n=1 Tax=Symsagittifera roscoffensis TaxID=84072 RepID=UPI00307BEEED
MQSSSKLPECSICTDIMDDPRQLPCGHSYCGPPKTCLDALKSDNRLKCALCKDEYTIEISDLKPMYGMRELLKELKQAEEEKMLKKTADRFCCFEHLNNPVSLWCKTCRQIMCAKCVECEKHFDHEVVSFTRNLRSIIKEQVENLSDEWKKIMHDFEEEILKLKFKAKDHDRDIKRLEELEIEKKMNESSWNELKEFANEVEGHQVPKKELFEWFFKGSFNNIQLLKNGAFAEASTLTEVFENKSTSTQTIDNVPKLESKETQTNFPQETRTIYLPAPEEPPTMRVFNRSLLTWESSDLMNDNHFLNVNDIDINPVSVIFPFRSLETETFDSNWIVTSYSLFQLSISRISSKLHVKVEFIASHDDLEFTVEIEKKTGSDYWIWRREPLSDEIYERQTNLNWSQIEVKDDKIGAVIRASVHFHQ